MWKSISRPTAPGRRACFPDAAAVGVGAFLWNLWLARLPAMRLETFAKYLNLAALGPSGELPRLRLLDASPLYYWTHLAARRLFEDPAAGVRGLQAGLTAASACFLFLLLRRHFGAVLAWTGTAAFLLSRSVIVHTALLEPEALMLFSLTGFAFFFTGRSTASRAAGGCFFALALLTRQSLLPVAAAVPFLVLLGEKDRRRARASAALFLGPVLVALAVVAWRSSHLAGSFTPLPMSPGAVFFEGNNPNSAGQSAVYPPLVDELTEDLPHLPDNQHEAYRVVARRSAGRELSVGGVNRFWYGKALDFIADHPGRFLSNAGLKAFLSFNGWRRHDTMAAFRCDRALVAAGLPEVPFSLVAALAAAGLVISAPAWRSLGPMQAVFLGQMAVMLLTYASDRQRVSLAAYFVFFAAAALHFAWRRRRAGLVLLALAVPLTGLLHRRTDLMRDSDFLMERTAAAAGRHADSLALRGMGDLRGAAREASAALALAPWSLDRLRPAGLPFGQEGFAGGALAAVVTPATPSERFAAGILLLEAGRLERAEELFLALRDEGRRFVPIHYRPAEPAYYLGLIASRRGNRARAVEMQEEALARSPGNPYVLSRLWALTGRAEYRERLFRYFDEPDARFLLGRALLEEGRAREAAAELGRVRELLPELRRVWFYLAAALAASGDPGGAALAYLTVSARAVEPVMLESGILGALRELASGDPGDGLILFWLGQAAARYGRYEEALMALERAAHLLPGDGAVAAELESAGSALRKLGPASRPRAAGDPQSPAAAGPDIGADELPGP